MLMRWLFVLISLLLSALILGCTTQEEFQTLRADIAALERQRIPRDKEIGQQLHAFRERLARLEQAQAATRRELAQAIATTEEMRVEMQRLRGTMQETRHRLQRGPKPTAQMRDIFATKLAELATRLGELESRINPEGGATFSVPKPSGEPSVPPSSSPPVAKTPPPTSSSQHPVVPRPAPTSTPPANNATAERLYAQALKEYQQGNNEVAIVRFKQFLRQYARSPLAGDAQYWIGEALYAQKQFEAAIVAFDEVIRKYPRDEKVPAALLRQGYAFIELKDPRNARFFLHQVQKRFPESPEARQAAEKLKEL